MTLLLVDLTEKRYFHTFTKIYVNNKPEPGAPKFKKAKSSSSTNDSMTDILESGTYGKDALKDAKAYVSGPTGTFSYSQLINLLEMDGYSSFEAKVAAENCGADWNQQAVKRAEEYLRYSAYEYSELVDQLEFDGFTSDQAKYAADKIGLA